MEKIWNIQQPKEALQQKLVDALAIHPIVAQMLVNRQVTSIEQAKHFLSADLSDLLNPFLLKGMTESVARIDLARQRKEKVLVYGDYDVDGVTATVIMHNALRRYGVEADNHIPHRMTHGYGLNAEIGEIAKKAGVSLIITVDCGINAVEAVDTINALGIDVLIIDHHEPGLQVLPQAVAIINPKQKDCSYPFKHLAGVGLAGKIAQALLGHITEEMLDFICIGTVADVVPLLGENRIFVKNGLRQLNLTSNKGLKALLESANILGKKIRPYHIGFILGPRINAAGRMDSAHHSLDLFLAQTDPEAQQLARELERHNGDRQKKQKDVIEEAIAVVEKEINFAEDKVIVVSQEGWHKGILGIVASRIAEKYYRPSIVISIEEGVGTGSGRSIDGFHLHEGLESCAHLLERFGGHEGAAGLTIKQENIEEFRRSINRFAQARLEIKRLIPKIDIECEIALSDLTLSLASAIELMEPFGESNPEPVFCSRGLLVKSRPQVMGKETLKFWVGDGDIALSAVGFGMAKLAPMFEAGTKVDLAYHIGIDDWNKAPIPQIILQDIKLSEA